MIRETPDMARERIDEELAEHLGAEWSEATRYGGEVLHRFFGRHWLAVQRERLKTRRVA